MLFGGDEIGRTQGGNNNGYCQDNEISWYDWENVDDELLDWVKRLVRIQNDHPVFRRRRWFQGRQIRGIDDMAWFRPDGDEMSDEDWESGYAKSVGVFINGRSIQATDPYRRPHHRRHVHGAVQRQRTRSRLAPARPRAGAIAGSSSSTAPTRTPAPPSARRSTSTPVRCCRSRVGH